jgi:hypothetical protein
MKSYLIRKNTGEILATREYARELFVMLRKEKVDTLDFKDVVSVSRSFANEWINLENEHNYVFKKINMDKDVSFMFNYADKKIDSNILKNSKYRTVSLSELMSEA